MNPLNDADLASFFFILVICMATVAVAFSIGAG